MRYLGRALKRRSNRRRFNALPPILKKAITSAMAATKKRMPPKRAIRRHYRKAKLKISQRRQGRKNLLIH